MSLNRQIKSLTKDLNHLGQTMYTNLGFTNAQKRFKNVLKSLN